jgi:hypothetical protein
MVTLIRSQDLEFGDSVLNFGDALYKDHPDRQVQSNVLRLCAFLLFGSRVGVPTRHVVENTQLFQVLKWMPSLLKDGLIFVDMPLGRASIAENIATANYVSDENDADVRARFLEDNSSLVHVFDATAMTARYHGQFLKDLAEDGALRRLLGKRFGKSGPPLADGLASVLHGSLPSRHDELLSLARSASEPWSHQLIESWGSVRYFTTPMDFDLATREVPVEASALMLEAEALALRKSRPADHLEAVPEPMRSAVNVMELFFPVVFTEADAKCLIEAVLRTRAAVPEARIKFADVTSRTIAAGLREELNGTLRDEFSRERLLLQGSPALSDGFKAFTVESAASKIVDLVTMQLSPVIGGLRAAATPWLEDHRLRTNAPWKTTCEYLRHAHESSVRKAFLGFDD